MAVDKERAAQVGEGRQGEYAEKIDAYTSGALQLYNRDERSI